MAKRNRARKLVALDGTQYTGVLAEPIWLVHNALSPEFNPNQLAIERASKLPALFDLYSVPPGQWKQLAMALACAHVKGFQVASRAGAPRKIGLDYIEIGVPILLWHRANPGLTDVAACEALTAKPSGPLRPISCDTALRRYKKIKKASNKAFGDVDTEDLRKWFAKFIK